MNSKISSEITRIELQEASYKDTGCRIEPTFVNFFFGNNGTGKSTIAKTILSGVGVTYTPGRTAADYLTLVYNQDFIDANFRSYRNMKGVFTLNAKNAEVQRKIDEKTEERIATQKALTAAIEKQTKQLSAREKLRKAFYKDCWDKEKAFREEFAKTQSGKGKSEPFAKEILKHTPKYSPRSDMFFQRDEIRLALGCLMLMFPRYVQGLENGDYVFLRPEHLTYYRNCIMLANEYLTQPENAELLKWIRRRGKVHVSLTDATDYAYCGLMYQLFEFQPFAGILDTEMDVGVVDIRPTRNLAKLTQIIGKFEYLHRVDVLDATEYRGKRRIDQNTEMLFNLYLRLLFDGGITEYEDDSEYAPSGCVSFLTIHQSKGMEFPIVLVDSLSNVPRKNTNDLMMQIEERYFKRPAFEPHEVTKFFDFWRLYYTAFSRAQDLLILTCNEDNRTPSNYFKEIYGELQSLDSSGFDIQEFDFKPIKDVNIKNTYSFTSHISVYETCALQYKFYKELEFMPVRANAMLFGTLVHETIEDIHRAALRHEEQTITTENISRWFDSNYVSLTKTEHTYLAGPQREAALKQVLRYVDRQHGDWSAIQQAEVDVSLVKPDYIIEGKVDLIRGEGDTVEIVDFKSQRKPDMEKDREQLERYRRQLHIYAHLVEERTEKKVSKMHIYYTGEDSGVPTITYPYTKSAVEGTMAAFDDTVKKIMKKDFRRCAEDPKVCNTCDFRFYCRGK